MTRKLIIGNIPDVFKAKWSEFLLNDIEAKTLPDHHLKTDHLVLLKFSDTLIERVPTEWVCFEMEFKTWVGMFAHNGKFISSRPNKNSYAH